ncbi:MAG: lysophospholipid acyltransferase family protein [Hyphomicrobiales bacterium]
MSTPWYKRLSRHPLFQSIAGNALAGYVLLVHHTTRRFDSTLTPYPRPRDEDIPAIFTFWHGEHFMIAISTQPEWNVHAMISRSSDGTINAIAAEKLGIKAVRGAGDTKGKGNSKGGMQAFRVFLRLLRSGASVSLTADVPKIAREVSPGLVKLAQMSGRPIIPYAYVTHPHMTMSSWDRASINLPFSKASMGFAAPIYVDDSHDDAYWCALIKERLDEITARSYELCGGTSPFPLNAPARLESTSDG